MNKDLDTKNKYEGQALAIVMIVLVVSSLIALSVYSRTMKDKGLTLEERASAEALEVSDFILDKITAYPIYTVIEAIGRVQDIEGSGPEEGEELDLVTGVVLEESGANDTFKISAVMEELGILESNQRVSDLLDPICPITDTIKNEYQLTLITADEDIYYEIRPGQVWSLPAKNIILQSTLSDECSLGMKFAVRGSSKAGFVLTRFYCSYDDQLNATGCDEYIGEHIENYCFSDDGENCNNSNFDDNSDWVKYNPEDGDGIPVITETMGSPEGGAFPSEVRIKAVGGTIGISYVLPPQCAPDFRLFVLRVTANCSGVYRGKEILIPEQKWHNTLFDYVFFNGEGSI